jgi:predicted O-methyltransferase YrrM
MKSSYIENNYGEIFYQLAKAYPPAIAVELGVLDGYSLLHIARAIKVNRQGHIDAYDLFEDYEFNHGVQAEVQALLDKEGLGEVATLYKGDAYEAYKKYADNSVHLLHIDISNTGETVRKVMEQWDSKMVYGGLIIFEGGSEERDNIEWMVKYKKEPMKSEIETNKIVNSKYIYGTYLKYPSLTVMMRSG